MLTQTATNPINLKKMKRLTKMAANWCANRRVVKGEFETKQRLSNETPIEQLLRHVLVALMRCETPTIANIAAEAKISEEYCQTIMHLAENLGFVAWQPATTCENT